MMSFLIVALYGASLLCPNCTPYFVSVSAMRNDAGESKTYSIICGSYEYSFGDRVKIDHQTSILRDPYLEELDVVLMIRDNKLLKFFNDANFEQICIKGVVVNACKSEFSTMAACIQSGDGKAVHIVEWLSP